MMETNSFNVIWFQRVSWSTRRKPQSRNIPGKFSKTHIFRGPYHIKNQTLCYWNLSSVHNNIYEMNVDIDELYASDPKGVCKTCHDRYVELKELDNEA